MNGKSETKSEIRARIDELTRLREDVRSASIVVHDALDKRLQELHRDLDGAQEDMSANILRSHQAVCEAKKMEPKAAFGNDPAVYYALGICGEAGEMANAITKAQRNGTDRRRVIDAVKGELADVIIYSFILAFVLDIDLLELVNEKVEIVIRRAQNGYYGGPLDAKT